MPSPGPSPVSTDAPLATGSPFWLRLHGVWVQVEGVVPGVSVAAERPRSSLVTAGGRRYEQRARAARRSWEWSLVYASAAHVGALAAAVDSEAEVWLMSEAVAVGNMLPSPACFGTGLPAVDCGGVPLGRLAVGATVSGRVRGGVPVTLSAWTDSDDALDVTWAGGSIHLDSDGSGRGQVTFTPAADGEVTATVLADDVSGLMLTEGTTPPAVWAPGESMPCRVVVDDPADTLRMHHGGAWRHDYSVTLHEVG